MKIINGLLNGLLTIAELLLGLRFVFRLLAANPETPFVRWVYDASDPVLYPFREIFPTRTVSAHYVFEFGILFAMVAYPVFVYIVISLLHLLDGALQEMSSKLDDRPHS